MPDDPIIPIGRIGYDIPGYTVATLSTFLGSVAVPACDICGALVVDTDQHDRWHQTAQQL